MTSKLSDVPLVSVIIPTYKQYWVVVEKAIESVIKQSYEKLEIILIDDNIKENEYSEDIKKNILTNYKGKIKYIRNEKNMGGSKSRNLGVSMSSGVYITFLDDDDEYYQDKIREQILYMIINNLDVCFTGFDVYNRDGRLIEVRTHTNIKLFDQHELIKYHLVHHITGTPTFMYKKSVFDLFGGFRDVKMGQEFYLMYDTINSGANIGYLNKILVRVNRNPSGGISFGKNKILGENELYKFKLAHSNIFTNKELKYIRFRHTLVIMYTHLKSRKYIKFTLYTLKSFVMSPLNSTAFLFKLLKIRRKNRV